MDTPGSFTERLRSAMIRRGLTQKELAQRLELREATVSAWFTHDKIPSGATMLRLPGLLREDGHWLLTGELRGADGGLADPRAELEYLLERAVQLVREGAGPAPDARVREAGEGESRALDAVRAFQGRGRARTRKAGE